MDHKRFLAGVPAERMARLSARSDVAGMRQLALHLGLIAALGTAIAAGVPGWWALLPVQGVALIFLFTLEHECTHKTPFASERLNEAMGHFAGLVLILPFTWFRYYHLAHHRHTNIPGRDPELATPKPATRAALAWHVTGLPTWAAAVRTLARLAAGTADDAFLPERAKGRAVREARIMLALYAAALGSLVATPVLVWVWLLPLALGQPVLRVYLLAEHGRCPEVANMFDNTRTTFTNRLVRRLAWNMPYHVEHHVAPQVPFHRLPEFHALTRAHLRHTAPGYARFAAKWIEAL